MKNENQFESLAARARSEEAPGIDVAGSVIAILRAEQRRYEAAGDRPLMWLAAFSSAAAVSVVVAAVFVYQAWADPLFELSQAISWVAQ